METEERGALQEGEGDLVRENGDGSEDPDTGEDTVSTSDEKGEENVARDEEKVGTSVVDTAAPTDAVNSDHDPTVHHPLSLSWCFSFNHSLPVHNISTDSRRMVFYVAGHTGVLFDCENNRQCLLQGHGNPITCVGVSGDKRWLVTGDQGHHPLLIVWDSFSGYCKLYLHAA
ncbi:Cilia- and flagella-associated protein 251 [Geodia barretti]|uniref:Cilia- and flagella-associated protein 251 n=1 Tax=Geodia barretti TaxID=519541 RepID=A0AA35SCZ9_GEOBA|nr:Cilia- and flagella-associated protein 251 [Geodia barretti]